MATTPGGGAEALPTRPLLELVPCRAGGSQVMLSYCWADVALVDELDAKLQAAGLRVWARRARARSPPSLTAKAAAATTRSFPCCPP